MSTNMPEILQNFSLFVDGKGYAGKVAEIVLPKLTLKTEEYSAGGLDAPMDIDLGMEKLMCECTMHEYDPAIFAMWGLAPGNTVNLTLRGGFKQGNKIKTVIINLTGSWKELDMGTWKRDEKASLKIQVSAQYYGLVIDALPVVLIDIPNMKRIIGGKDMLSDLRKAIGV